MMYCCASINGIQPVDWPTDVLVTGVHTVEEALKLAVKAFQASSNLRGSQVLTDDEMEGQEMDIDVEGTPSWISAPMTMEEKLELCQRIIDQWHAAPSARAELIDYAVAWGSIYL